MFKDTMTTWPVQKTTTQNNTKTRRTPRRYRHSEKPGKAVVSVQHEHHMEVLGYFKGA